MHLKLFIFFSIFIISCNSFDETKHKELILKERELIIREKELSLKEQEAISNSSLKNQSKSKTEVKRFKKELRYLQFSNGGIRGYFDDGTIVGCPRCDLCKSNIEAMLSQKPMATYIVKNDGTLIIDGNESEKPEYKNSDFNEWALIDYKWYVKPIQD